MTKVTSACAAGAPNTAATATRDSEHVAISWLKPLRYSGRNAAVVTDIATPVPQRAPLLRGLKDQRYRNSTRTSARPGQTPTTESASGSSRLKYSVRIAA